MKVKVSTFSDSINKEPPLIDLLLEHKQALWASRNLGHLVTCGEPVKIPEGSLRGHGIIQSEQKMTEDDLMCIGDDEEGQVIESANTELVSSLTGIVTQVNRLHYVESLHSK